ncbi:uncharacterized protein EV422DRAFT_534320 [Fimicolochytrium jonesii]|uniref:uncharacterized protein n=1 Tax=Fimicolochytrium jonesii TaxID=1396493 RepID=UPI0022FDD189|nr:uncharacterized protein EV422DRAFT_534320 [Fimicolochytrium jonesii]KAI8819323.1 hypothetical protein EV422DRAFT_534320 [Fimicolochytrium jonesii]
MNWTTGSRSTVKKNLQRQKQQQFFQKQRQQTTITGVDFAAPGRAWAIVAGKERKDSKCAHGSNPTSKSNADPQVSLDLINLLGLSPKAAGTGGKNHSRRAAVTTPSRASTPLTFHTPTERSMERADSSRGNQNPTSMGAGSNADLSPRSLPESTSSKGRTADWDAFLTSEHRLKGSEEVVQKEASSETPGQIEDEESEELSMSSSPKDVQKTLTPHTAMEHVEFTNFLKEPSINWQQCSSPDTLSSIASFTGISKHASQNWNDFLASPLGIIMKRKGFGFDGKMPLIMVCESEIFGKLPS